jgi:hypothetical protein
MTTLEKLGSFVAFIISQGPGLLAVFTTFHFSIYQPAIYEDYKLTLAIPVAAGLLSLLIVHKLHWIGILICFALMVVLICVVYRIYNSFDIYDSLGQLNSIHGYNWALSYCVFALLIAMVYGVIVEVVQ